MRCAFVAVEWDATNLRAYAVNTAGAVMGTINIERGIQGSGGRFEQTLGEALSALRSSTDDGHAPVLMAGMIGSRQGWIEAPYVTAPCDAAMLAAQLTDVASQLGRPVKIVPGVVDFSGASPDVMRGEETQLIGLHAATGFATGLVCMPGTHCKWVRMEGGRIVGLRTYMTGEAFKLFAEQSMLARLMEPNGTEDADDWTAFDVGFASAARPGHLLNQLFAVRTDGLFGRRDPRTLKSYLSGLLVGHELGAVEPRPETGNPLVLVGDGQLTARYQRGLDLAGAPYVMAPEDIFLSGLTSVARAAGWVAEAA